MLKNDDEDSAAPFPPMFSTQLSRQKTSLFLPPLQRQHTSASIIHSSSAAVSATATTSLSETTTTPSPTQLSYQASIISADGQEQPLVGIRFSYIWDEFIPNNGGIEAFNGLSTQQVKEIIIRPFTKERRESYCDLLKRTGSSNNSTTNTTSSTTASDHHSKLPACGPSASAFISHAHQYQFLDTINALQYYLRDDLDAYIFLDIFCINQHRTNWSYDFLSTAFQSCIQAFGRTIVVMSPWNDPIPFTRAWCIYEAYCTKITSGSYHIALSESEKKRFLNAMQENNDTKGVIETMLETIQAEKSQAYHEDERERIHTIIQESVGFDALNELVFKQYRDWVVQTTLDALQQHSVNDEDINEGSYTPQKNQRARMLRVVGTLYQLQGRYLDAESKLMESIRLSSADSNHPIDDVDDWIQTRNLARSSLGSVQQDRGDYTAARATYESLLKDLMPSKQHTGSCKLALATRSQLAYIYFKLGLIEKAETMSMDCLVEQRELLSDDHPDTLATLNHVALLYENQRYYSKALSLFEACLSKRRDLLGDMNPATLSSMHNLAVCQIRQEERRRLQQTSFSPPSSSTALETSRTLLGDCIKYRKVKLGSSHPETVESLAALATLHEICNEFEEAKSLYIQVLGYQRIQLGINHQMTLASMHKLGSLSMDQGDNDRAERLLEDCYERRAMSLGKNHTDTLQSMHQLGVFSFERGDFQKAVAYLLDCYGRRKQVLDLANVDTLTTMHSLALAYARDGKDDLAEPLLVICSKQRRLQLGSHHADTKASIKLLEEIRSSPTKDNPLPDDIAESLDAECAWTPPQFERAETILPDDITENLEAECVLTPTQFERAETILVESLLTRQETLGSDHLQTIDAKHHLARLYNNQDHSTKAQKLMDECYNVRDKQLGNTHPDTLDSLKCLAVIHEKLGNIAEYESLLTKCLELQEKALRIARGDRIEYGGTEQLSKEQYQRTEAMLLASVHEDALSLSSGSLMSVQRLALLYKNQEEYRKSFDLLQPCFDTQKAVLDKNHADTLDSMRLLADVKKKLGSDSEHRGILEACLKAQIQLLRQHKTQLGRNHQKTLRSTNTLGLICMSLGHPGVARFHFETCLGGMKVLAETRGDNPARKNHCPLFWN